MNTPEILDAARRAVRLPSDRKLAQAIGITEARISGFRTGRRKLDGATAVKIAELMKVPPAYLLALVAAERAKDQRVRREWLRAARLLKKGLAAAVVVAVLSAAQPASQARAAASASAANNLYIMRNRRRRRRRCAIDSGSVAKRTTRRESRQPRPTLFRTSNKQSKPPESPR